MSFSTITWLADKLMQRGRDSKAELRNKWDRVADYFDEIANCLEKMVSQFKDKKVPRIEGNQLKQLIHQFPSIVHSIYSREDNADSEKVHEMLSELSQTAERATNTDLLYALEQMYKEGRHGGYRDAAGDVSIMARMPYDEWIPEMERVVGRYRGLAAALRAATP